MPAASPIPASQPPTAVTSPPHLELAHILRLHRLPQLCRQALQLPRAGRQHLHQQLRVHSAAVRVHGAGVARRRRGRRAGSGGGGGRGGCAALHEEQVVWLDPQCAQGAAGCRSRGTGPRQDAGRRCHHQTGGHPGPAASLSSRRSGGGGGCVAGRRTRCRPARARCGSGAAARRVPRSPPPAQP